MLTVLALSSVVQKPIQTRWPVPKRDGNAAAPTKLVIGRGTKTKDTKTFLQRCCAVVYVVEQSCVHIVVAFQLCGLLCGRAVVRSVFSETLYTTSSRRP